MRVLILIVAKQTGEPFPRTGPCRRCRVYPRAGGGTVGALDGQVFVQGLFPRRRGNLQPVVPSAEVPRSIPAQAGEPGRCCRRTRSRRVYPRAGGGTIVALPADATVSGLSPRRRGNLPFRTRHQHHLGSIPAQAGEPSPKWWRHSTRRVYPRAGGGTRDMNAIVLHKQGLSPRRRGNRRRAGRRRVRQGSIPAQAGEPRGRIGSSSPPRVYPRAGGGTAIGALGEKDILGLSPRRRGNPSPPEHNRQRPGSIPAQAGEPV